MAFTLENLVVGGHTLDQVCRYYGSGMISESLYESYYQLWRRAAPRFLEPYTYSDEDARGLNADVIGPLGAATIARFLDYCNREVLFF